MPRWNIFELLFVLMETMLLRYSCHIDDLFRDYDLL